MQFLKNKIWPEKINYLSFLYLQLSVKGPKSELNQQMLHKIHYMNS